MTPLTLDFIFHIIHAILNDKRKGTVQMQRKEIYDTLDEIENGLLEIRDNLDIGDIDDDTDYSDINDAIESAIGSVQDAMCAADHERFESR